MSDMVEGISFVVSAEFEAMVCSVLNPSVEEHNGVVTPWMMLHVFFPESVHAVPLFAGGRVDRIHVRSSVESVESRSKIAQHARCKGLIPKDHVQSMGTTFECMLVFKVGRGGGV